MYTCHCVACILLLGTLVAASPATTAAQDQAESGMSELVSREVRLQANILAQRFRRAKNDFILREQIADEAIQLGRPYAHKVLEVADFENNKSLKTYGAQFTKQIDKADRISAAGVVSSSTQLQESRQRLIELKNVESKLREFLNPLPPRALDDEVTIDETAPNFEENLRVEEEGAVERWLLTQGYGSLTSDESSVISAINRLRQEAGLGALEIDYKLCFAARDHSHDMVRKHFFSHLSPVHGKKTFSDRAQRLGTVAYGENIAKCNTNVTPITLWLNSKPHKKIMYGKWFNTIGVGRVGNNYTAMFGRKAVAKTAKETKPTSN